MVLAKGSSNDIKILNKYAFFRQDRWKTLKLMLEVQVVRRIFLELCFTLKS